MIGVIRHRAVMGLCLALLIVASQVAASDDSGSTDNAIELGLSGVGAIPESADWGAIPHVEASAVYDPLLDVDFDEGFEQELPIDDPFETTNRRMLGFNRGFDRWMLSPIMKGYQFVVPGPARRSLRRALTNLNSPSILVNDLLQLRFQDAAKTVGRFVLNSTVGFGGLFDVGVEAGWDYHHADFGQTLARVGVGSGPYLMLPILGPNNVRDGVGSIVDVLFQPLTYLIGPAPNLLIGTGRGLAEFEAKSDALKALEESSVDYYAALRSAYVQHRRAQLEEPMQEHKVERVPESEP